MSKAIINTKKWTRNDFRLLVVLLLTVIYPVFVSSFFALYIFILLPVLVHGNLTVKIAHEDGWYHYYWLFVSFLWLLLCALILPCFRDKKGKSQQVLSMNVHESPSYPTKASTVQPFVQIEEGNGKQRHSMLTDKSQNSSESIEKVICNEKAEKESLEKSRQSLQKSTASLSERRKLTESGEFFNDFIDSIDSEELKKNKAECEVHAENNKDDNENNEESDSSSEDSSSQDDDSSPDDKEEKENQPLDNEDKDGGAEKASDDERDKLLKDEVNATVVEPTSVKKIGKQQETPLPFNVDEADIIKSKSSESLDEIEELEEAPAPLRTKARPTIDTSRASACYECSMPTPKSADVVRPESNVVFLFVNPDIASTEESIKVEHTGDVQEA